jgi:hypothetical protein
MTKLSNTRVSDTSPNLLFPSRLAKYQIPGYLPNLKISFFAECCNLGETYVKWHSGLGPSDEILRLSEEFDRLCVLADYQELEALIGTPGFTADSMRTDDLTYWKDLPLNLAASFEVASSRINQLKAKLQRPIDPDAFRALDHDLLFS